MNDKLRIRNDEELQDRKKGFLEIVNILKANNVYFFIQGGLLLGAVRNNDFIKWDWDVEISFFADEFFKKKKIIKDALLKNGFKIYKENNYKEKIKIDVYKYQNYLTTGYTLFGWNLHEDKEKIFRGDINIPIRFIKNMDKIDFLNTEFNCPGPVDEYLTFQYGDWKTELRSDNKNEYLTKNFYKKNFFKKLINRFKEYLK
ncbi:LicD family protein [Candidatus Pelagibacter sp.]|nr:LicD family protein [Candidatus Pelagibacter sp.]